MYTKIIVAGLFALLASTSSLASTWYVNVDTSLLNGQTGYLDFQFLPGDASAPPATASIAAFTTTGTNVAASPALSGDVIGDLNSTVILGNSQFFNDLLQGFTFGTNLSFSVNLDLPIASPDPMASGTAFSLWLYDASYNALLSDPAWGATLVLDLKGSGVVDVLAKSNAVSLSPTAPVPVPLPGSIGLLLGSISALSLTFGKGRKKQI